jgi:peptidylprolyl isomerase
MKWWALLLLIGVLAVACGPAQDLEDEAAASTAFARGESSEEEVSEAEGSKAEGSKAEGDVEKGEASDEASGEEAFGSDPSADFDLFAGFDEEDVQTTASGLRYIVLREGDGESVEPGRVVQFHVTGMLNDGTVFLDTRDRGSPASIPFGEPTGIAGLDEAMRLFTIGSRSRLILTPDLAFGDTGAQGVPPGSSVVIDLELVALAPEPPEAPTAVAEDDYTVTDSGLKYYDQVLGEGPELQVGQTALVDYTGWLEDGTLFDSSIPRGQPIPVVLGQGGVIQGWQEGLQGMQVGGKRQLVIPPELAYGEQGAGASIPPNAVLIFEIEVVGTQ